MSSRPRAVLGIETSCDETAAAVVSGEGKILSNVVSSQIPLHRLYRGVVPELASRAHLEAWPGVLRRALRGQRWDDVGAIAYTQGPGLAGALLVGKVAAETLAYLHRKPLVPVHHLEGHALAVEFEEKVAFPFLAMVVSGGHTDLIRLDGYGRLEVLARTRDDAAGEAFDKGAKLLGLSYPGGPEIDRLSRKGDPKAIDFPRSNFPGSLDFSFSGLKTSLLYYLRKRFRPRADGKSFRVPRGTLPDLCASYQEAILDTLIGRIVSAAESRRLKRIVIGGGVAANRRFREKLLPRCEALGFDVRFVPMRFCTDNAAMIALAGMHRFRKGKFVRPRSSRPSISTGVEPALPFESWAGGRR